MKWIEGLADNSGIGAYQVALAACIGPEWKGFAGEIKGIFRYNEIQKGFWREGTMNPLTVQSRIKSLETQISVLKAQMAGPQTTREDALSFGQIYGLLSKVASSTDEDIEEAKYRSRELEANGEPFA